MTTLSAAVRPSRPRFPWPRCSGYATNLRSLTQGRATYTMEFQHYAEAPKNVADEVTAARGR